MQQLICSGTLGWLECSYIMEQTDRNGISEFNDTMQQLDCNSTLEHVEFNQIMERLYSNGTL